MLEPRIIWDKYVRYAREGLMALRWYDHYGAQERGPAILNSLVSMGKQRKWLGLSMQKQKVSVVEVTVLAYG